MSHNLAARWYRGDFDQCIPTERAFAEDVLMTFKELYLASYRPPYMDCEDHDPEQKIDPYNCEYSTRDAVWLLETWKKYTRPKYKKALGRWYKETGGGSRDSEDFVHYCGGDTWLAQVYAIDENAGFILASEANDSPPSFMRQEAGFENACSDEEAKIEHMSLLRNQK